MDSISLSQSVSKEFGNEKTSMSELYFGDLEKRIDAITTEVIEKGNTVLDTYKVLSDAISGGMGSVWRVHHQSWNTDLAMKRPQPRFFAEGGDAKKKQFIEECENWINLGLHPNIVSCYYVREIGGVPTIFSEWMDNGSLKDRIADGSLYEGTEAEVQERILDIAIQAARGLQYSHENGLIHQDMKPGNLLLSKDWDAKVADFGLAKAKSDLEKSETAKTTGYTLAYCPTEQANGGKPEKWMDVYAWALTVLEMYAGKRLWDTGAEAKEHFDEYIKEYRITPPKGMPELIKICLRMNPEEDPVFDKVEKTLLHIYRNQTEKEYPVNKAETVGETADSVNNKALSYLDLGFPEQEQSLLQTAVHEQNNAQNAVFNYALLRWRRGDFTDSQCLSYLREHLGDNDDTVNEFVRERGYEEGFDPITKSVVTTFELLGNRRISFVSATDNGDYVGVLDSHGSSVVHETFTVYSCDKEGRAVNRVTQISVDTTEFNNSFSVIGDTLIVYNYESTEFYRFETWKPYYIIKDKAPYMTEDGDRILKLQSESSENGKKYDTVIDACWYESLEQLTKEQPVEKAQFRTSDYSNQYFTVNGKLFVIGDNSVAICDPKSKSVREISFPSIERAVLRNKTLYILVDCGIKSLDTENLSIRDLGKRDGFSGRICVTPDEKHLIVLDNAQQNRLKIYDTDLCRCVADWYEDRFNDWQMVTILTDSDDAFTLQIRKRIFVKSLGDYQDFYAQETYRIPVPGEPCAWRLSRIQSIAERLEAERAFDSLLKKAEDALKRDEISVCLSLVEEGCGMQGFEQNCKLRSLNRRAGKGREITGIRYIQRAEKADYLTDGEKIVSLIGADCVLTRRASDDAEKSEYRLIDFNSGRVNSVFSASKDSFLACVSRDNSLAVVIESIRNTDFTVCKLNLNSGKSERINIPQKAEAELIQAATDGKRIYIDIESMTLKISGENDLRIIDTNSGKGGTMLFGCFSPDGRYFASSYMGDYGRKNTSSGNGVVLWRSDALFAGDNREYYIELYSTKGLDINDDGMVLSDSGILSCPDLTGVPVRCVADRGGTKYIASSFTP